MAKITKKGKLTFYDDVIQGTQEWLKLRTGRVTCSNALTLINKGKNAAMEANRLAHIRVTPNGNDFAERGHFIEHQMKENYNKVLNMQNLTLADCGFITNEDYPEAGYSPDGLICPIVDGEPDLLDIQALAEFKAYNDVTFRDENGRGVDFDHAKSNYEMSIVCKHRNACRDIMKVPPEAIAQCNMAMLITGADLVYLFLCNPDADKTDKAIKKVLESGDEKAIEKLKETCPGDDFSEPTPFTKVWEIKRNNVIIERLIKKLSH